MATGAAPDLFSRIVVGVDGSPAGLVAVRQAVRLVGTGGELVLVSAAKLAQAAHAGMAAPHAAELMRSDAEAALAEAVQLAPGATARCVDGDPAAVLLAESANATLVAVGTHEHRRGPGLLLGSVASRMLRDAPSAVLIARAAGEQRAWPDSIVVGLDGSEASATAMTVARALADRFGGAVRALVAPSDHADVEAARASADELEEQSGSAVASLVAASESADLLLVGSRGLHGLKALGSVSERVAHQARSSVLVVRGS